MVWHMEHREYPSGFTALSNKSRHHFLVRWHFCLLLAIIATSSAFMTIIGVSVIRKHSSYRSAPLTSFKLVYWGSIVSNTIIILACLSAGVMIAVIYKDEDESYIRTAFSLVSTIIANSSPVAHQV